MAIEKTKSHTHMTLIIALNYSGRWDMVQATKKIALKVKQGEITIDEMVADNDQDFKALLKTIANNNKTGYIQKITAEGKPVDTYVDGQTYYHQFRSNNLAEEHVYDLDFIKLRELSLGYNIPIRNKNIIQRASVSFVARNPWLIYAQNRDFDPSEISNIYGESGQFPGTRSFGINLKLGF